MLKNNKLKILISSVIILIPAFFGIIMWDKLPDVMTTHWGADGNADGFSGKAFAVFGLSLILLALHFLCLLFTLLDKKQKEQNQKALGIIFWIIPAISLLTNGIIYQTAFGKSFNSMLFMPAIFGLMFIFIGNYLPKIKQNRTLGIKIYWTLNNEENWNKTHRLGGKVWVIGGFIILLSLLFPLKVAAFITTFVMLTIITIPIVYSYIIYKQHQKDGTVYTAPQKSKAEKIIVTASISLVALICIVLFIIMFTGNVKVLCESSLFKINATYWSDINVEYSEIDNIEYRKDFNVGVRRSGFGSARLSLGVFENEEFGPYTLYAYTGAKEYIVLTSDEKMLVIGLKSAKETQAIYDTILEKVER